MTIPKRICLVINHIILIQGSLAIIGSSIKIEADTVNEIPDTLPPVSTSTIETTSINSHNEIPTIINTNLIARLILSTTPNITSIRVANGIGNTTISEDKTTKFRDFSPLSNLKILNKAMELKRYKRNGRFGNNKPTEKSELQPEGYIYDLNHCQYVDNRVLCGYDKNPEPPKRKDVIDLDDLCKKHGDRIECGYVTGPFPDAYNPDPEKDKIAKINLSTYQNIARSGNHDNGETDKDMALRTGNMQNMLLTEILKLRIDILNLIAALPANTNLTFVTTPTSNTISAASTITSTFALPAIVTKETSDPNGLLYKILRSGTSNLTLASLLTSGTTTTNQAENTSEKKCVEKDGRIFCRTV